MKAVIRSAANPSTGGIVPPDSESLSAPRGRPWSFPSADVDHRSPL